MTLGVALVGFGVAGRQHAAALEGAQFAQVRGVLEDDTAVDTAGLPRCSDWAGLLADPAIDLVALCIPPGGRGRLAQQALAAGKAVLLEKPPASSAAEVDSLVSLAERLGRPLGVMLQHRYRIPDRAMEWDWRAGTSGVLEVSRFRPVAHYRRAGWRQDPSASLGGITAHLGVHYLDLACQLLGEPEAIQLSGRREHAPGIDSRVAGVVEYRSGATLSFVVTAESTVRSERLQLLGSDHRLLIEDGAVTLELAGSVEDFPAVPTGELRREVYRDMAEAVALGGSPRRCGLQSARGVTTVLETVAGGLREAAAA